MLKKLKRRHLVAISIIMLAISITPYAIKQARIFRGYDAIGGEFLIIPLGIVLAMVCAEESFERDKSKEGGQPDGAAKDSGRITRASNI